MRHAVLQMTASVLQALDSFVEVQPDVFFAVVAQVSDAG